jgi:hypothetical protein
MFVTFSVIIPVSEYQAVFCFSEDFFFSHVPASNIKVQETGYLFVIYFSHT